MRMTIYVLMAALAVISANVQAIPATSIAAGGSLASAASSSSSSSSRTSDDITVASSLTNATSQSVSVWSDDDYCSATTQRAGCTFDAICDVCLSRSGCAIQSTTGKCVSISRINSTKTGVEYFWNGNAEYCDASDAACTACASGASDAPCYGDSGCFCLRQCELQSKAPLECAGAMSFSKITYLLMVVVAFGSFSLCIHIRRIRINNAVATTFGLRRLVQRRPRRDREPHPMALKLDNWKKDRVDHSEEFVNIELKSCFIQMDDDDDSQRATILHDDRNTDSFYSELEGFECGSERDDSASHSLPATTGSEATITAHMRRDSDQAV